jgi:hypothetical protein
MALNGWYVKEVSRKDITVFIETWHYSKSINGCICDFNFALYSPEGVMKGAMFYGRMAMANQWKRFSDKPTDVIELRRLCCVDATPKNAESFFIGQTFKLLRKIWLPDGVIVSYSDKEYGHVGTIYKATNFVMTGEIAGAKVIMYGEKRYHDKAIRAKYKGVLKPFAKRLILALENGDAEYKNTAGKFTYVYNLCKKKHKKLVSSQR